MVVNNTVLHSRLVDVQEIVAAESPDQVAGRLPTFFDGYRCPIVILGDDARVHPGSPVSRSEGPTGP